MLKQIFESETISYDFCTTSVTEITVLGKLVAAVFTLHLSQIFK